MNNILVTGASGQIGKILVKKFNKNKIVGLDIIQSEKANFPFIEIDLKNGKKLKRWKKILEEVNILIHLASTVNSSQDIIKDGINIKFTPEFTEFKTNIICKFIHGIWYT